jgi:TonB family protein
VNKASGPYTIPQAPAGNWDFLYHGMETGRKELSAASLVLNAGGRSFKNWPDFNFLEAAPFTVLNKNVRIELTIAGDGTILNSVILPPGSGNAALNDELIKALRNASFNEADSLNTESQTAILSINFRE